ncbi:MAG: hypothetical protein J0H40_17650 [Rhizobiales bacterium]|nr:hypothetical protein [Hyphomicrobiales bacterium]
MMIRKFVKHFENRLSELSSACMMLGLAVLIMLSPDSIAASAFRLLLNILTPAWLGWGFAIAGTARLAALIANGHWQVWGPILRAWGAFAGAFIWSQMCIALIQLIPHVGSPPSPGIPVYLVLTIVELVSIYRALVPLVLRDAQVR